MALTIQKPSLGRVVLINFPGIGERAGVVGAVNGDGVIAAEIVRAEVDDPAPDFVSGVEHNDEIDPYDASDETITWRYPPRENEMIEVRR